MMRPGAILLVLAFFIVVTCFMPALPVYASPDRNLLNYAPPDMFGGVFAPEDTQETPSQGNGADFKSYHRIIDSSDILTPVNGEADRMRDARGKQASPSLPDKKPEVPQSFTAPKAGLEDEDTAPVLRDLDANDIYQMLNQ